MENDVFKNKHQPTPTDGQTKGQSSNKRTSLRLLEHTNLFGNKVQSNLSVENIRPAIGEIPGTFS